MRDAALQDAAEPGEQLRRAAFLLDHIGDAVVATDPAFRIQAWNKAAELLYGFPAAEVLGRDLDAVLGTEHRAGTRDDLVRALRERGALRVEVVHGTATGARLVVEASFSLLQDAAGRPLGTLATLRDLSASRRLAAEHARAEAALQEGEQRFRALVTATSAAIYRMSADWRELRESRSHTPLASTDWPTRTWLRQFIPREERRRVVAAVREAIRRKAPFELEHRVLGADGRVGWAHSRAVPVLDAGGAIVEWFGSASDITARKRAEEALRESEERFRLLAQAMPPLVCMIAPDGTVEYVNDAWVRFSGLDLASSRAIGWQGVVHPDDYEATRDTLRRTLQSRAPQDLELRYRTSDGSYRWFLGRLAPILAGDRVIRLIGAATDIEDHKRAEEALRSELALKDQLAKIAASVPGVVCSYRRRPDGSACMPFAAPAIADLCGLAPDELARDVSGLFGRILAEDVGGVQASVEASARDLTPWRATFRYAHPAKGIRWLAGAALPTREPDGAVIWHGYVGDVTEHKQAEAALLQANERLREADRRKDEFLAVLSHELRNPLAPIRTSIHLLERAAPGSPQASRAHEVLRRQVDYLTHLVDDLLDVTRVSRGKINLRRAHLDLRDVVRTVAEDLRPEFDRAGIALGVEQPDRAAWVDGDAARLAQVVGNLLHNALKFTPAGGRVTLSGSIDDGRVHLVVRDTGIGMLPDQLDRMFEPFAQADQGLARTRGGLGLGLSLVKALVEGHGGTVRATSDGPGRGSAFHLALPMVAGAGDHRPVEASGPRADRHGKRVLVIEDNADAASTLAELLEVLGHEVRVASEGQSGLRLAHELRPDVVLCDIGLPDLSGYELAPLLRRDPGAPGMKLVALTGYARPEDCARAAAAGFDEHLPKPPSLERLEAILGAPAAEAVRSARSSSR